MAISFDTADPFSYRVVKCEKRKSTSLFHCVQITDISIIKDHRRLQLLSNNHHLTIIREASVLIAHREKSLYYRRSRTNGKNHEQIVVRLRCDLIVNDECHFIKNMNSEPWRLIHIMMNVFSTSRLWVVDLSRTTLSANSGNLANVMNYIKSLKWKEKLPSVRTLIGHDPARF